MSNILTSPERELLNSVREKADDLAKAIHDASQAGFIINFNINAVTASCDIFQVSRVVPIDMRAGAN